jgi:hypothetical protein
MMIDKGILHRLVEGYKTGKERALEKIAQKEMEAGIWLGNTIWDTGLGIRRSLRRLVDKMVGFCEIPFEAACLYWDSLPTQQGPVQKGERRAILPVKECAVKGGEEATMEIQPLVKFRPTGFVVDPLIASYFVLLAMKVEKDFQAISTDPIPCTVFAMGWGFGQDLDMDEVQPHGTITIHVRNTSTEIRHFRAHFVGKW